MLLLIPLGVDSHESRFPRATLALIALNVLVFFFTSRADVTRATTEQEELERIAEHTLRALPRTVQERAAGHSSALAFFDADDAWPSEVTSSRDRERIDGIVGQVMGARVNLPGNPGIELAVLADDAVGADQHGGIEHAAGECVVTLEKRSGLEIAAVAPTEPFVARRVLVRQLGDWGRFRAASPANLHDNQQSPMNAGACESRK